MSDFTDYQIKKISNIATDLLGHKVVFFIGAGFSRDLGYPGWGELLKEIITENNLMEKIKNSSLFYLISEREHFDYKAINNLMLNNLIGVDFLRLAGYVDILLKENGKQDIQSEIKKKIFQYEDKRINNSTKFNEYREILKVISHYISEIITTNYDTNLEYCLENVSVIHRNLESINNNFNRNIKDNIKLYKIHGCINDDNNGIIITEKNYQDFNSSNKYIFNKLYSTFMENNIVFIGYSLTDPNIRSLLSEVLDEININQLQNKKIYWINRGNINDIDKTFYQNIYSLEIIDKIDILDFFKTLHSLADSKWNELEKVDAQWKDVADELISKDITTDADYIDLIHKTSESQKLEQILLHIFNSFLVNDSVRKTANKIFFILLSKSSEELIKKFETKVMDMLAIEDNHLLSIIDLLMKDDNIKQLFIDQKYVKKLLESLLARAKTVNDFYLYKRYTIALLDYYKIFEGDLCDLKEDFINAFILNYQYLTNTRTLGYSWESLNDVIEKIGVLDYSLIKEILTEYPETNKSKIQKEQIMALTSKLEQDQKTELRFKNIIKPQFSTVLVRKIIKMLGEKLEEEKGFENHYEEIDGELVDTYKKEEALIIFKTEKTDDEVCYTLTNNAEQLKIKFYANYKEKKILLEVDEIVYSIPREEEGIELVQNKLLEKLSIWFP